MDIIAHDIARRTTSGFEAEALMYEPMVSDAGPIAVAADGTVSTSQGVSALANEGQPGGDRQKPADRDAGVRSGGNRHARQRRLRRAAPGLIESSNVNPVAGITALITAQRAYDLNSKVITASDEMMATVIQLR